MYRTGVVEQMLGQDFKKGMEVAANTDPKKAEQMKKQLMLYPRVSRPS